MPLDLPLCLKNVFVRNVVLSKVVDCDENAITICSSHNSTNTIKSIPLNQLSIATCKTSMRSCLFYQVISNHKLHENE